MITFEEALDAYRREFGEGPPARVFWELDPDDAARAMHNAVKKGDRLEDEPPPEGVVI